MDPVTIYDTAAGKESLELPITTTADPTATPPAFSLTAVAATQPGTFIDGTWSGTWSSTTRRATAVTALIGRTGSHVIATGNDYDVWVKVTVASEIAVWVIGRVHCP